MLYDFIKLLLKYLQISDMDEKKKDKIENKDAKCLVPFTSNTPRTEQNASSSVFLTPPSTGGQENDSVKKAAYIPCFPRFAGKIPFNLSLDAEELEQEYRFDIVKELYLRKTQQTVIKQILNYLDDLSLFRASHVCKTWRNVIRGFNGIEKERMQEFISKKQQYCKEQGKENIGTQKRTRDFAYSILENTPKSPAKMYKPCIDFNSLKYRPCPKCSSPAIVNNKESAICKQCNEDFCLQCFRTIDGHNLKACNSLYSPKTTSTERRKSRAQIGSKQSKERLRRLSKGTKKS